MWEKRALLPFWQIYCSGFSRIPGNILIHEWILIFALINQRTKLLFSCSVSHVWLFATLWTAVHQASLSITNSQSLFKLMCIESVMPSNHLILCCPLLLLPLIFPRNRVFPNELALCTRWPKYWNFSCSISPSNEYSGLIQEEGLEMPTDTSEGPEGSIPISCAINDWSGHKAPWKHLAVILSQA